MIRRALGGSMPWLLAVLLGIAVYAGMQARHYSVRLEAAQAEIVRAEQRAEILLEHQRWQRRQIDVMAAALDARDDQLQRDAVLLDAVRGAAQRLERDDAETRAWADQPVPAAVAGWLHDLAGDGERAGGGGADGAGAPVDAAAGAEPGADP